MATLHLAPPLPTWEGSPVTGCPLTLPGPGPHPPLGFPSEGRGCKAELVSWGARQASLDWELPATLAGRPTLRGPIECPLPTAGPWAQWPCGEWPWVRGSEGGQGMDHSETPATDPAWG